MDKDENYFLDLIRQGEGERIEFKTRLLNEHDIAKVLTAFANTNGGYLLVGVGDKGQILGISDEETRTAVYRLEKICNSIFSYPVKVDSQKIGGRNVVFASVDKAPDHLGPITTGTGELYLRKGDGNVRVTLSTRMFSEGANEIKKKGEIVGFIAMSFRNEEEPALVDYYNAMLRAADRTKLPIKLTRIDLNEGDFEISQQIMTEIEKCSFVIADFTLNPHNVYFEAGFARGVKKRIIQTARKGTVLQFDVRNWTTLFYRNATELEEHLISKLQTTYKELTGG
jgi:hypothetical protein